MSQKDVKQNEVKVEVKEDKKCIFGNFCPVVRLIKKHFTKK